MKSRTEKRTEFLYKLSQLITRAHNEYNIHVAIFWFFRTKEQQYNLYRIGRVLNPDRPTVTNCDGTLIKSKHQDWLAADLCVIDCTSKCWMWENCEAYETLGMLAFEIGLKWGGDWGDSYHFEYVENEDERPT